MSNPCSRWISLLAFPLAACVIHVDDGGWSGLHFSSHHRSVRGSGVRAEAQREVPEFHAIELEIPATVHVRVGEPTSVHLSGDDNLLPLLETTVEDGVLSIGFSGSYHSGCALEVVIGTPSLEGFSIEGSGDVRIEGVAAKHLELGIEGSGTLRAEGHTQALEGSIEGSGTLSLAELHADEAELSIEGSGSMDVHVAKTLRYSIEGSGDIRYAGAPEVHGAIEGSGSVEKSR